MRTNRHHAVGSRRRWCRCDVNRPADHVDGIGADPFAVADGDGSLEAIDAGRRLFEEVDEHTGVDAAVGGRGDSVGGCVMVAIIDEQFAEREWPTSSPKPDTSYNNAGSTLPAIAPTMWASGLRSRTGVSMRPRADGRSCSGIWSSL